MMRRVDFANPGGRRCAPKCLAPFGIAVADQDAVAHERAIIRVRQRDLDHDQEPENQLQELTPRRIKQRSRCESQGQLQSERARIQEWIRTVWRGRERRRSSSAWPRCIDPHRLSAVAGPPEREAARCSKIDIAEFKTVVKH